MDSAKRGAAIVVVIAACTSCYSTQRIGPPETGNSERYAFVPVAAGIGVAGAALSRATGGCYSMCAYGTACNPNTGACESAPENDGQSTGEISVPFGTTPYADVDPHSPNDPLNTPVEGPPVAQQTKPEVEASVDRCASLCKLDELCERLLDDDGKQKIACVPKGPLPPDA